MECRKNVKRLWTLPFALVLISCGSATSDPQPEREVRTCIINYSVHPVHGGARMGDQRRAILARELGAGFDGSALARDLRLFSDRMIADLSRDMGLPPFAVEQVRGGYKGETSDSLTATARYMGDADQAAFTHLTSAVGYVFMQDGMIIQCTPPADGASSDGVPALVLDDVGAHDDLNPDTVGDLYAEMLEVTGFNELGFTYDPAEDALTILVFSDQGWAERMAMSWVVGELNAEGAGAEVALSEDARNVSFLGHRWEDDANGTAYKDLLSPALESQSVSLGKLDAYQRTYLSIIDTYTAE